ncbi:hypothetical protein I4U23_028605 [Adineta vaga]|nr:hypothetical protein I4U23_028605 [Adineta vaga]
MVRRTSCLLVGENNLSPICESLRNRRLIEIIQYKIIIRICMFNKDETDLSRCHKCQSLLRPHIIGTSCVVYPAAGYASILADRNVPVVKINIEITTSIATFIFLFYSFHFSHHFHGPAAQILPQLL